MKVMKRDVTTTYHLNELHICARGWYVTATYRSYTNNENNIMYMYEVFSLEFLAGWRQAWYVLRLKERLSTSLANVLRQLCYSALPNTERLHAHSSFELSLPDSTATTSGYGNVPQAPVATRLNEEWISSATRFSSFMTKNADELLMNWNDCYYHKGKKHECLFFKVSLFFICLVFWLKIFFFQLWKYTILIVNKMRCGNKHFDVHFWRIRSLHFPWDHGRDASYEG